MQSCDGTAAIIPLGPDSHRGSSSLPEGFQFRPAYATLKWSAFRKTETLAQRAGPALPSYLALHHAGFSVPRLSPSERWALTPPFHPYLQISISKASCRFPCAMPPCSISPAVFSLWHFPWTAAFAAVPLALPGASPMGSRPCGRKPWCPDFPPGPAFVGPSDHPAHPLFQVYAFLTRN